MDPALAQSLNIGVPKFGRAGLSGQERRQQRNALPQEFLLYTFQSGVPGILGHATVYGRIVVEDCTTFNPAADPSVPAQRAALGIHDDRQVAQWVCGGTRALPSPTRLPKEACKSWKGVCVLERTVEVVAMAQQLGLKMAGRTIRGFRVQAPELAAKIMQGGITTIVTTMSVCGQAGVAARELGNVTPRLEPAPPSPVAALAQNVGDDKAFSGSIDFFYKPRVVMRAWALSQLLSAQKTPLRTIVQMSLSLVLEATEAQAIKEAIKQGTVKLPGREVLRVASFRMNLLDLLFQRELCRTHDGFRYLASDASKQGQFNFFVVQEDRIMWPAHCSKEAAYELLCQRRKGDMELRHLPTTTLGLGAADLKYKVSNTCHAILLETWTLDNFDKFRFSVRSWTSDQGLEYSIGDGPCLALPKEGS